MHRTRLITKIKVYFFTFFDTQTPFVQFYACDFGKRLNYLIIICDI